MTIPVISWQENIAAALDLAPRHISIARTAPSPEQRSARAWGTALGKPFFAKKLLLDPYVVTPRLSTPWDETTAVAPRSADKQIEIEWSTTIQLQRITGADHVPGVMGKSLTARTIIWQDADGEPLDDLVKRRSWIASWTSLRSAVRQAGTWLRKLHDCSNDREVTINLGDLFNSMRTRARRDGQSHSLHAKAAIHRLHSTFNEIGQAEVQVPIALSHGDFMLSNLVWNRDVSRVFVVDFENFAPAAISQDLLSMIFDLRSQLLNPLIPKRLILSLEKAFWDGYGPVSKPIMALVNGVASARVSYFHLPQALNKRMNKGGLTGAAASVYKAFLQPSMLARCQEGL